MESLKDSVTRSFFVFCFFFCTGEKPFIPVIIESSPTVDLKIRLNQRASLVVMMILITVMAEKTSGAPL